MAARKNKKTATRTRQPAGEPQPPEGFNDIGNPDVDAWLYPQPGTVVQGKIVGAFKIADERGERDVLLVKVRNMDKAICKRDQEEVDVSAGDVIAIGVVHKLRDALSYVEHGGEFWCHYQNKRDIGGGQTMWNVRVACKGTRSAPPVRSTQSAGGNAAEDMGDIPF